MYNNEVMVNKQCVFQKVELSSKFSLYDNNMIMLNKQGVFQKVELSSKVSLYV